MARKKSVSTLLAITAICGTMFAVLATSAQAALGHVDGTVLSKDAGAKTFRISTQNGNRLRFRVNANTEFERIAAGFSGLHRGMRIEVDYVRTSKGLLAKQIEPQGGGGGGDDGGNGGADDGPNHS